LQVGEIALPDQLVEGGGDVGGKFRQANHRLAGGAGSAGEKLLHVVQSVVGPEHDVRLEGQQPFQKLVAEIVAGLAPDLRYLIVLVIADVFVQSRLFQPQAQFRQAQQQVGDRL